MVSYTNSTFTSTTLFATYNNLESVCTIFASDGIDITGVILESVVGNSGSMPPISELIQGFRYITTKAGALLCLYEVMAGFRVAYAGEQSHYGIKQCISTFGKVIGGGLPVGSYGECNDVMSKVAPSGPVHQAGTRNDNPLTMTAGTKTLDILQRPGAYEHLYKVTARLMNGLLGIGEQDPCVT